MSDVWNVVIVSGVGTLALKATGPVLLGGKPLPDRFTGVVGLLAPALLAALVAIGTFASGQRLVLDGRACWASEPPPSRSGSARPCCWW